MAVPYTFTNGTVANATEVNANFVAVAPADLATRSVLDVGVSAQTRAGRALAVADFTTLLGLSTPVGLYNLGSITNLGSGGALVNKGTVTFAKGITGTASEAAQFTGSTAQALYTVDTGASDPFRLKTGSFGCWFRTAKRAGSQALASKYTNASRGYYVGITASNVPVCYISFDGTTTAVSISGVTDVCDDRWHFVVATIDGSVTRLYVDGALEASGALAGVIFASVAPLNIGGFGADAGTAAGDPHFGRIDEAFVTADVLTEEQIRLLMAVKIPHAASFTPREARVTVRRRKRGPVLATSDFTATPLRLINLSGQTTLDIGSLGGSSSAGALTAWVVGPDGANSGAAYFNGTSDYLGYTDTGLPSGTSARTLGAWFKTTSSAAAYLLTYGTTDVTNDVIIYVTSGGVTCYTGANNSGQTPPVNDGQWHHVVYVVDPAPADGLFHKVYIDGRLAASSTSALVSTTLGGANKFRIGANKAGAAFFTGSIARVFVSNYAMAQDEVSNLFAKGSALIGSLIVPALDDQSADQIVQGVDATNLYILGDVRKRISGKINSDGTVAEMVGGEFRVVKNATGDYYIYFAPGSFSSPPIVTATPSDTGAWLAVKNSGSLAPTATRVALLTFNPATSTATDGNLWFTAEGRGPINSQHQLDLGVAP